MGIAGKGGLLDSPMIFSPPPAEQQIAFLHDLQRIFEEGDFSATYKLALLMTLAELAVEAGNDSGDALTVSLYSISEKFIELYWRQGAPYSSIAGTGGVLWQNRGTQAAVVRHVNSLRLLTSGNISVARRCEEWRPRVLAVARVIREMPLRHLQVIAGQQRQFLYEYPLAENNAVELKPGVVYNLRRFQGFIQQMARSAWVDHIRSNRRNEPILGKTDELEAFMFGTSRADLSAAVDVLVGIQSNRCFYCDGTLRAADVAVDHFIPWSRYPRDTAHNFVLAHRSCNADKRELLPAKTHLERWVSRNVRYKEDIGGQLCLAGFTNDLDASKMIAQWAYDQSVGGHAWIRKKQTEPIDSSYASAVENG
jgi:5-methylcytosine-specific restriction endonuclease McrA